MDVLVSTKPVIKQAKFVKIDKEAIFDLAKKWAKIKIKLPIWSRKYHFFDGTEKTLQYLFLLDSLNFCFWPESGEAKWGIKYKGENLDGYYALSTSLKRALEEGYPLLKADYLANISEKDLAYIFKGRGEIPLFKERLAICRENGKILKKFFQGQFVNLVKKAEGRGLKLVEYLIKYFPSFRDWASWRGKKVFFLKRAQILVADIYLAFRGKKWGAFCDLEKLTCFADYKLPQLLVNFGILKYSQALLEKIKNKKEIIAGSCQEIEIRASTIWAVEYLKQALKNCGINFRSFEIDSLLWEAAQKIKFKLPYHRTRTIFY